jgi:hypothetical protein
MRQANGLSDRRWIVLCEDGRSSTLSRERDPDDAEIARAEGALKAQGLAGWLAIQSHSSYVATVRPDILEVRALGAPTTLFADAVEAFRSLAKV